METRTTPQPNQGPNVASRWGVYGRGWYWALLYERWGPTWTVKAFKLSWPAGLFLEVFGHDFTYFCSPGSLRFQVKFSVPGRPVAHNLRLLYLNTGLRCGTVAYCLV